MKTRTAYMVVNRNGNPVIWDYRAPVYWRKRWAITEMEEHGETDCRVVSIELPKQAPHA